MKYDIKKLKIIAFVLILMIFIVMGIANRGMENVLDKKESLPENVSEVVNNSSQVIYYNEQIFYRAPYRDGTRVYDVIARISEDELKDVSKNNIVIDPMRTGLSENLTIFANFLLYSVGGNTYAYDFDMKESWLFSKGELQYIDENEALVLIDNQLHRVLYTIDTFTAYDYSLLVSGTLYPYSSLDDERIYFSAVSNDGTNFLIGYNIESRSISTYYMPSSISERIVQVKSTPNYICILIEKNDEISVAKIDKESFVAKKIILEQATTANIFIKDSKKDDFYINTVDLNGNVKNYLWEKDDNKFKESNDDVAADFIGAYKTTIKDNSFTVYKDNKSFFEFNTSIEDLAKVTIKEINVINDYMFFEIEATNNSSIDEEDHYHIPNGMPNNSSVDIDLNKIETKRLLLRMSLKGKDVQVLSFNYEI